ncbi:MAG: hypothetical protein M3179_11780 [Actinomycetota bacterium]|nr:hypothetical protein [Actinomycetota bacterium]
MSDGTTTPAESRSAPGRAVPEWWWPVAGLIVGVWAALPRWVTPAINTSDRAEFADHVVPSMVLITVSIVTLVVLRRSPESSSFMFVAGLVLVLAGLWMFATHVPLVAQALRDEAPWGATIYHSTNALTVLIFGILWTAAHWNDI